jgi:hypothetical protein
LYFCSDVALAYILVNSGRGQSVHARLLAAESSYLGSKVSNQAMIAEVPANPDQLAASTIHEESGLRLDTVGIICVQARRPVRAR